MPMKVYFQGGYAEADTPEEAAVFVRLMNQATPPTATPVPSKTTGTAPIIRNEDDAVTQFFAAINDNSRKFLTALARHPSGVKADQFGEETGFTTEKFGGILGGASKLAKKYSLKFSQFVISEMRNDKHMRFRVLAPGEMLTKHAAKLAGKTLPFSAAGGAR